MFKRLYLDQKMGYKVKEGPVSWHHLSGNKINLLIDSIKMFFNILQVRNWHCTLINPFAKYLGPDEYRYMYDMECYHWWFVSRMMLVRRGAIPEWSRRDPENMPCCLTSPASFQVAT